MFHYLLQVQSSYFLVSLVDNDYIHSDLFAVFADFWDESASLANSNSNSISSGSLKAASHFSQLRYIQFIYRVAFGLNFLYFIPYDCAAPWKFFYLDVYYTSSKCKLHLEGNCRSGRRHESTRWLCYVFAGLLIIVLYSIRWQVFLLYSKWILLCLIAFHPGGYTWTWN